MIPRSRLARLTGGSKAKDYTQRQEIAERTRR